MAVPAAQWPWRQDAGQADDRSLDLLMPSGLTFHLLEPRPEDVSIEDIAHALAQQCRFAGHVSRFYSIAEHSVYTSQLCEPADALWGLLHDAAEAYLGDLIRPLKTLPGFECYQRLEARVLQAVCGAFGLPFGEPSSVKAADSWLLQLELREFLPMPEGWVPDLPPEIASLLILSHPAGWEPEAARATFLDRFETLRPGRR